MKNKNTNTEKNDNKNDTREIIQQYYDKALKYVVEQNKKLSKLATDVNAERGLVETYYTRGIWRKDFSSPLTQSITAEEMANDGYFSLILNAFSALCSDKEVTLSYKISSLAEDKVHQKILDFVNLQLDSIGGYHTLFEKTIKPSFRWGTGIGQPILREIIWNGRRYAGMEDLRTINLQNVLEFMFEEENPSRVSAISFLTYPKIITSELSNAVDSLDIEAKNIRDFSEVGVKTINAKNNALAIVTHNAIDGNPLGTPYLYFLYPIWKTYKAMLEGTYNAMISFGQYPFGIKRINNDSGVDSLTWGNNIKAQIDEIIALGGAPFISGEGQMYTLEPPDTQKLLDAQKSIFDIASRASGLGQITMGIQGGGSKNLVESVDVLTDKYVKATLRGALIDINETMIKNLVNINFKSEINRGKVIEYPALRIKE